MKDNEIWQLRSCYTDQTATVNKNLREGFEPFAVYKTAISGKSKVKMYFRKAPTTIFTELESVEAEPLKIDLSQMADLVNQWNTVLTNLLNQFTDRLEQLMADAPVKVGYKVNFENPNESDNATRQAPSGDTNSALRVVDDVPQVPKQEISPQQESVIESLKAQHGNITRLPSGPDGSVKVMAGSTIYTILSSGNFTQEETNAKTSSLI